MKAYCYADGVAFRSLLGIGANGEAPTYDGLYSGEWKHPKVSGHG